jgi:hypothetical protein
MTTVRLRANAWINPEFVERGQLPDCRESRLLQLVAAASRASFHPSHSCDLLFVPIARP